MANGAPEDSRLGRSAALLFGVGIALLIISALLRGWLAQGGETMPGPVLPVVIAGIAALVGGAIALVVLAVRGGPKKQ